MYEIKNFEIENILLIDSTVKDYEEVVNSVNDKTMPIVYHYHSTRNEIIKYISQRINQNNRISRIGIFADEIAIFFLENDPFFLDDETTLFLSENTNFIVSLINQYDVSYIDYFACNTLKNPKWMNYYAIIMALTNVIVGASNNQTGNIQYGGDWIMENTCQDIEQFYFTKNIKSYKYLLDTFDTGFFYYKNEQWIDICNNMYRLATTTNSAKKTTYKINRGDYIDLADQFALNLGENTANDKLNFYTLFNNNPTDLGYLFNSGSEITPAPLVPKFTLTSTGISGVQQVIYSPSLSSYSNVTALRTISRTGYFKVENGPINVTIAMIGPGGNGGSKGATANSYGNGGSGGQVYWAKISLPIGDYTAVAGCPGINSTTPGTNTTFTCTSSSPQKIITAYAGNNGSSNVTGTTASFALCPTTPSNPSGDGGFTVVNPSNVGATTNINPYQFFGGRGGGYANNTTNPNSYGGPGFYSEFNSVRDQSNLIDMEKFGDYSYDLSIATQTSRTWDGSSGSVGAVNSALNISARNLRFISNFAGNGSGPYIEGGTRTNIRNGTLTDGNFPGMITFSAGGGGGYTNTTIGGGTGGNYYVGGSNNSGGFNYAVTTNYIDPYDDETKSLKNGTNGIGFGCGGGGSSSATGAVGGKGAPGVIFIYVE